MSNNNYKTLAIACMIGFLVSIVLAITSQVTAHNANNAAKGAKATASKIVVAEKNSCEHVQELRENVNSISLLQYRLLVATGERSGNMRLKELFDRFKQGLVYLPPTDCRESANNPDYKRPNPEAWDDYLREGIR